MPNLPSTTIMRKMATAMQQLGLMEDSNHDSNETIENPGVSRNGYNAARPNALDTIKAEFVAGGRRWWGPHYWGFFHRVALFSHVNWTAEHRAALTIFYSCFDYFIPCGECSGHYRQEIQELPMPALTSDISTSGDLFQWTVDLHNSVNARLGKPQLTISEVLHQMQKPPRIVGPKDYIISRQNAIIVVVVVTILLLIVIGLLIFNSRK